MKTLNTLAKLALLAVAFCMIPHASARTATINGVTWRYSVSRGKATVEGGGASEWGIDDSFQTGRLSRDEHWVLRI